MPCGYEDLRLAISNSAQVHGYMGDQRCRVQGRKGANVLLCECGAVNPALAGTSEGASKRLGTVPGSGGAGLSRRVV